MRFLHTADWQVGMRARHVGARGVDVRARRVASARALIEVARTHAVDAVLLAGDVFEDNAVERSDVQRVVDVLSDFRLPVYVIPGNHDPFVPGSVWAHPAWSASPRVQVLSAALPVAVRDGVTLYPCPALAAHSTADPTAWIANAGGDGTRIGIAHGTVEGATVSENCFPIPRDAAQRGGLAYLALGHWHSAATFGGSLTGTRMAYSGTHETTKFGERDSGNVLIVDITGRESLPRVQRVPSGHFSWHVIERELRDAVDLEGLIREVDAIAEPDRTLLEIRLSGVIRSNQLREVSRLRDIVGARFPILGRIDDAQLLPAPQDDGWTSTLPLGVLRDVATRLRAQTTDEARRALMLLYGFCSAEGEVRS